MATMGWPTERPGEGPYRLSGAMFLTNIVRHASV